MQIVKIPKKQKVASIATKISKCVFYKCTVKKYSICHHPKKVAMGKKFLKVTFFSCSFYFVCSRILRKMLTRRTCIIRNTQQVDFRLKINTNGNVLFHRIRYTQYRYIFYRITIKQYMYLYYVYFRSEIGLVINYKKNCEGSVMARHLLLAIFYLQID